MQGYFKKYPGPSHKQQDGDTPSLPTWLGFGHEKYNPIDDPPYHDIADIFGMSAPPPDLPMDCSQPFGPHALGYQRICGERERDAKSHYMANGDHRENVEGTLGMNTWWNHLKAMPGEAPGSNHFLHTFGDVKPTDETTNLDYFSGSMNPEKANPAAGFGHRWFSGSKAGSYPGETPHANWKGGSASHDDFMGRAGPEPSHGGNFGFPNDNLGSDLPPIVLN